MSTLWAYVGLQRVNDGFCDMSFVKSKLKPIINLLRVSLVAKG